MSEVTRGSKPLFALFAPQISGVSYINWYFPMLGWTFSVIIMADSLFEFLCSVLHEWETTYEGRRMLKLAI